MSTSPQCSTCGRGLSLLASLPVRKGEGGRGKEGAGVERVGHHIMWSVNHLTLHVAVGPSHLTQSHTRGCVAACVCLECEIVRADSVLRSCTALLVVCWGLELIALFLSLVCFVTAIHVLILAGCTYKSLVCLVCCVLNIGHWSVTLCVLGPSSPVCCVLALVPSSAQCTLRAVTCTVLPWGPTNTHSSECCHVPYV